MRTLSALLLCLMPNVAVAGGDAVPGKVSSVSGADGNYQFHFVQTANRAELISGCKELDVKVSYERVPWFSWLPFVHSSHPTREKTDEAASYLLNASRENRDIYLGYMGSGLIPAGTPCSFLSRGCLFMGKSPSSCCHFTIRYDCCCWYGAVIPAFCHYSQLGIDSMMAGE